MKFNSRPVKGRGFSFHAARRQAEVDSAAAEAAKNAEPKPTKRKLSRAQQRALGNKRRGERLAAAPATSSLPTETKR